VDAAVEVFKAFGDFASFGFIGHPSKQVWSRDRGALFSKHTSGMAAFFYRRAGLTGMHEF